MDKFSVTERLVSETTNQEKSSTILPRLSANLVTRVLSLMGLIATWYLVVQIFQPELLPGPVVVFQTLINELSHGDLVTQLGITLTRVIIGFVGALVLGMALGLIMGYFRRVDQWLDSSLTLLLNIPALVTIILCFMWLGLNETAAIAAVIINKLPNMAVIFREGAKAIDHNLLEVAKVYRLSCWRTFTRVYLPQLHPYLLAATRSGQALVWKIVLVVELLGCSDGVGFKLSMFFQLFDIAGILAYTLAFVVVIYLFESMVLRPWERRIQRYQQC